MKEIELTVTVPASLDYLGAVLAFVRETALSFGLKGKDADLLVLAVEESVTNVIHHGLADNPEEQYTLLCRGLPASLEVVIREKGMPFQAESAPQYQPENLGTTGDTSGLGMYLLRRAVDQVKFINLGRGGKETVLIKHLPHKRVDTIIGEQEDRPATELEPPKSWYIREFRKDDALEVSRCAWQAYGYSYEPYIYYPDMIIRMNREGNLQSLVAMDENEKFLGHFGLKFYYHEDPIAEVGVAFVNPCARKLGVFSALFKKILNHGRELGLYGVYGRAVTSHTLSQKKGMDLGFHPIGIFLGLFPSDVDFKKLTGKIRQKESGLLYYADLNRGEERTLYAPPHHKDIIEQLFAPLHSVRFSATLAKSPRKQPKVSMETSKMEVFNSVDILCFTGSADMVTDIRSRLHKYCMQHVDVLYLHLNLEDEATPGLVGHCEEMGFFFSGVLPYGLHGCHCLILQYCNNLALSYDAIKLYGSAANSLKEYIKKCDPNQST